jgi:hypothetical protein
LLASVLVLAAAACSETVAREVGADAGPAAPGGRSTPSPAGADASAVDAAPDVAREDASADAAPDAAAKPPFACQADGAFPGLLGVPEASSSAEVELTPGVRELIVISDSGRNGQALLLGLPGGATRTLTLPLDIATASDDLEGAAWHGGRLYTLTSSGAVRRFAPSGGGGLTRDQDAYRLGNDPITCPDLTAVNCGRNYEGLCLRPAGVVHPCAGYAASKAEGKLYCLGIDGSGKLFAKTSVPPLALGLPADQLSDCAFGAEGGAAAGVLVVTANVFGGSKAYRVDEGSGALTRLPIKSLLNVEAAAIDRDGALYVFDDNSQSQSMAARVTCVGW